MRASRYNSSYRSVVRFETVKVKETIQSLSRRKGKNEKKIQNAKLKPQTPFQNKVKPVPINCNNTSCSVCETL